MRAVVVHHGRHLVRVRVRVRGRGRGRGRLRLRLRLRVSVRVRVRLRLRVRVRSAHTSGSSQPSALSVSKKRCGRAVPVKPTTRLRASRAAA